MALRTCPECHRDVSEYAEACPHCAYPIASPPGVRTVEQTAKVWKAQMLIAGICVFAGLVWLFAAPRFLGRRELESLLMPLFLALTGGGLA